MEAGSICVIKSSVDWEYLGTKDWLDWKCPFLPNDVVVVNKIIPEEWDIENEEFHPERAKVTNTENEESFYITTDKLDILTNALSENWEYELI